MAKECINCGAEIKFYQDYFCLMNQGVYFCGTCAQKAKPLLQDIKIALSDASYQSAKKKFDEELPQSGLSDRAQKYLQREFDDIAQGIPGVASEKLHSAKTFCGSFQACCDAIYRAGKTDHRVSDPVDADAVHQAAGPRMESTACCDGSL